MKGGGMSAQQPVIQTDNLTKVYEKKVRALDSLSLSVQQGEVFGYLGPNGAGKTTTIRLLLDLIRPTSGSARILGMDVNRDSLAMRRRVGFLPGELNLWDKMSAQQVIQHLANLRGGVDLRYVRELTERLEFDPTKKVRSYSSGNKRKLGLIIAMMHKPELLILDEPTNGLDPLMQQTFYQLVLAARDEGRTVFLSSHILSEVQAICDRVGILRSGRLEAVQTVSDLTHADFRWVTLRLREPLAPTALANVPGVSDVSADADGALRLRLSGDFDPLLRAVQSSYITDIRVEEPTLEEVFLTYYGGMSANNHHRTEAAARKEGR